MIPVNPYIWIAVVAGLSSGIGIGMHRWKQKRDKNESGEEDGYNTLEYNHQQYLKDLKRWGTKERVVAVANGKVLPSYHRRTKKNLALKAIQPYANSYKKDLKRWGTKERVVEAANDTTRGQRHNRQYRNMARIGAAITSNHEPVVIPFVDRHPLITDNYTYNLLQQFDVEQIVITNPCETSNEVALFDINQPITAPNPDIIVDSQNPIDPETPIADGLFFNPANRNLYGINQLGNSISVMSLTGELERVILLEPHFYPGTHSPAGLAVVTDPDLPSYGDVYVIGSVVNCVTILSKEHNVIATIDVGIRPIAIAYNAVNKFMYVVNFVSGTLSAIAVATRQLSDTFEAGTLPRCVAIVPDSGDILVTSPVENTLLVYDTDHKLKQKIKGFETGPEAIGYNPKADKLYISTPKNKQVIPITDEDYTLETPIQLEDAATGFGYNPISEALYVQHDKGIRYCSRITKDDSVEKPLVLTEATSDMAMSEDGSQLFAVGQESGNLQILNVEAPKCTLSVNEGYYEFIRAVQYNPALLRHVKFVFSTEDRFSVLFLKEKEITGRIKKKPIAFENFRSPQNMLNVSEVTTLDGHLLDNRTSWGFTIAPKQTITILLYFQQFEMYKLHRGFPPRTRNQYTLAETLSKNNL